MLAVKVTAAPPGVQKLPLVGDTVIVGLVTTVYAALVAGPTPLVTTIVPADNPAGVTAVIVVLLTTVKDAAFTKLNVTEVVPVKFVPVIVTVCPPPIHKFVLGVKLVIVGNAGGGVTNMWSMPISVEPKSEVALNLMIVVALFVAPREMLLAVQIAETPILAPICANEVPPLVDKNTCKISVPEVFI